MPFNRPTISAIIARMRDDIVSRFTSPDVLRRSNAEVYARSLAGELHGLYGHLDWISRQLIYDTADGDILERWAAIWGITRNSAGFASGTATFASTGDVGLSVTIPDGTELSRADGVGYKTVGDVVMVTGTPQAVPIIALVADAASNSAAGSIALSLSAAVPGFTGTVTAGILAGGADVESYDALRSRLLWRVKHPPMGGSKFDYVTWASEVAGVTRAWCYPTEGGAGTVTVRFMMDDSYSNGIPLSADVTAVAAHIDPLRPVTANITVAAPIADALNFTIASLSPATAAVKAAVTQNLVDLIRRESQPGGTLYLSHIREAISAAFGEIDHSLTTPSANVVSATGHIPVMGTITWA